jgi:hypothetical protein
MSNKLNLSFYLNAFKDNLSTTLPTLSAFKWNRQYNSLAVKDPQSSSITLQPGQETELFSGVRAISNDITTRYEITRNPDGISYVIKHSSGTAPAFRTLRSIGGDNTTIVNVTKEGNLLTFTSASGTLWSLLVGGVVVGDQVKISSTTFDAQNSGIFTVINATATSFTVENATGVAQSSIALTGNSDSSELGIYSANGVQIGDNVSISKGFSAITNGTYEILGVTWDSITISSSSTLPEEITTSDSRLDIYFSSKSLIYLEVDQNCDLTINSTLNKVKPIFSNNKMNPGFFVNTSDMYFASIKNTSIYPATVFVATVEL